MAMSPCTRDASLPSDSNRSIAWQIRASRLLALARATTTRSRDWPVIAPCADRPPRPFGDATSAAATPACRRRRCLSSFVVAIYSRRVCVVSVRRASNNIVDFDFGRGGVALHKLLTCFGFSVLALISCGGSSGTNTGGINGSPNGGPAITDPGTGTIRQTTSCAGGTCSCSSGNCQAACSTPPCALDCSGGNCALTCPPSGDCNLDCSSGHCLTYCGNGSCNVHCSSGSCNTSCPAGADCTVDCSSGSCLLACAQGANCSFADCSAGSCMCTGPGCH
jgi:hypothetical protein